MALFNKDMKVEYILESDKLRETFQQQAALIEAMTEAAKKLNESAEKAAKAAKELNKSLEKASLESRHRTYKR